MTFFIGVKPKGLQNNARLKQVVGKLKRTVKGWEEPVRWTQPSMWHVTVLYLGPRSKDDLEQIVRRLDQWQPTGTIELSLRGLGAFPQPEAGRVLWVGVRENRVFRQLHETLRTILTDYSSDSEMEFRPHLTLMRFRNARHLQSLLSLAAKTEFGDYEIEELILFESVIENNIAKYIPRHRIRLINDNDRAQPAQTLE